MNDRVRNMVDYSGSKQLLCQQCAAPLLVEQGTTYSTCEYCNTVNYLDKSEAVFHFAVRPTLDNINAESALRRWMAGNYTVKGLDTDSRIVSHEYQLFPMWLARTIQNGQESVHLKPAAALSIVELGNLRIPASDLEPFDISMEKDAITPTVPLTAVRKWLAENEGVDFKAIRELSLVHLPIYVFKYEYKGETFTAMVDAATGQVFAAIFPEKYELPYVSIGGLGCIAYFLAAFIPVIAYLIGDMVGLGIGMVVYVVVVIGLAIPIFIAASVVAKQY